MSEPTLDTYGYVLELDVVLDEPWDEITNLEGDLEIKNRQNETGWREWDGTVDAAVLENGGRLPLIVRHTPSGETLRYGRFLLGMADEGFYVGATGQLHQRLSDHLIENRGDSDRSVLTPQDIVAVQETRSRERADWDTLLPRDEAGQIKSQTLPPALAPLPQILLEFASGKSAILIKRLCAICNEGRLGAAHPKYDLEDDLAAKYSPSLAAEQVHYSDIERMVYVSK